MKDYAEAERLFVDLKAAKYGEPGAMDLYLAQIAEEQKRYGEAIERYRGVPEGERAWLAKLRIAAMLGKQGKIDEARRWLNELPAVTIDERVQVRQAEAQLLRDSGDIAGAYAVLSKALAEFPESPDLNYDAALLAEKLDRVDEAESRLRKLVALKPDDAQSLNALGYTLVDRTSRTDEGFALIERAHKLAPNDPFIMDSMGWALFRLGRLDEAESYLKRALAERPDAEIAAHLGEVLWAKGDRDSARAIWKAQLEANPDNAVLKETVKPAGALKGRASRRSRSSSYLRRSRAARELPRKSDERCRQTQRRSPTPFDAEGRLSARRGSDGRGRTIRVDARRRARSHRARRRRSGRRSRGCTAIRRGVRVETSDGRGRDRARVGRAYRAHARIPAAGDGSRCVAARNAAARFAEHHRARRRRAPVAARAGRLGDRLRVRRRRGAARCALTLRYPGGEPIELRIVVDRWQ